MARPHDRTPLPPHPAISPSYRVMKSYGGLETPCAKLTCPTCKHARWLPLYTLRQYFKRGDRFTGHCRPCQSERTREGHRRWLTKNSMGRHVVSNGYIEISPILVDKTDLPMFLAMCPPSKKALHEHRWVMAKHLGRPLYGDENVHHKDGNKQNNALSNLELWTTLQPYGQRVTDQVAWAKEILKRYG